VAGVLVWALVALFAAYFGFFAVRLYDNLLMKALDLGNMDQVVWQTAHGRPFYFTNMELPLRIEAFGTTSRLSFHVEPILLPLALLYRVVAGPPVLLITQAVVGALGALPLSWLARDLLASRVAQVAVPLAYLAHPMLQSAVLDEFHPVTLAPTFLLFAAYGAYRRRYGLFLVGAVLAVACKEDIGLLVAAMGLALAVRRRQRAALVVGLGAAIGGVGWSALAVLTIIPLASHGLPSPYWARLIYDNPPPGGHASLRAVLSYWREHPRRLLETITQPAKGQFAWRYLAPTALLAGLGPEALLLALPSLGLIAVTHEFHMVAGIGHYTAEIVPFAFLAALVGIRRLSRALMMVLGLSQAVAVAACCALLLLGSLLAAITWGDTPLRAGMGPPPLSAHARVAQRMLRLIPPDAAVSAEEGLAPHLGNRLRIYLYPDRGPHNQAAYVALDVAGDSFPQTQHDVYEQVQGLLSSGQWGVLFAEDGLLLLRRGAHGTRLPPAFLSFLGLGQGKPTGAALARFGAALELIDYRLVYRPLRYLGYPVVELATRWRVLGPVPADLHLVNSLTAARGVGGIWTDFAATDWYPPARWRAGQTFWVAMQAATLPLNQRGLVTIGVAVYQGSPGDVGSRRLRWPVTLPPAASPGMGMAEGGTLLHLTSVDAESGRADRAQAH